MPVFDLKKDLCLISFFQGCFLHQYTGKGNSKQSQQSLCSKIVQKPERPMGNYLHINGPKVHHKDLDLEWDSKLLASFEQSVMIWLKFNSIILVTALKIRVTKARLNRSPCQKSDYNSTVMWRYVMMVAWIWVVTVEVVRNGGQISKLF